MKPFTFFLKLFGRRAITAVIIAAAIFAIALSGVSWYYSDLIEDGAFKIDRDAEEFDLEIVSVRDGQISFGHPSGDGRWVQAGTWGLEWEGGFGQVRDILSDDDGVATRQFTSINGVPGPGTRARLTREAFQTDPLIAHELAFEEITFTGPVGELSAWLISGGDTWVILVHGRASERDEALRILPAIERAGMSSLVIDYRNDAGAPEDPSGYYLYGVTEWQDLEAAVSYAIDRGAESVIPYGYSMGGAIVMSFLYNSPLAGSVAGVVLDAPMLDLSRVIDQAASQRNLPGFVTSVARLLTEQRFGIEFDDMGYLEDVDQLSIPILLFHGDSDERVPVETSDELAGARPDLVTYERVRGAEHVHAWNMDPDRYESAVESFLGTVAGG